MKKALLSGGLEEFNLHTLPAKECDPRALGQVVDCLPMMSQRTMVVVSDYDLFKAPAPDREALAALFDDLPEYVCLVFVYDLIEYKPDARTKLAAALKRSGSVVKFTRQEQGDLVDWIRRRFRALDHDIDSELSRYLIFQCGDLMTGLISEIGKIGAYAKHRVVTREDIDAVATPQLDAVVFQLTDAITAGRFDQAAAVLADLLHMGEAPIKLLSVLGRQLRQLYSARAPILTPGNRIQVGWNFFQVVETEGGLELLSPDYRKNPFTDTTTDLSQALEVFGGQMSALRRAGRPPVHEHAPVEGGPLRGAPPCQPTTN